MSIHQNHSSNYTNSNMQYSNCKLTIPFTTSTSNELVNINVCTSMCTWSTSTKHLESRTMPWFWSMFLATSTRATKPIDQLQITQSACIHFNTHQKQRIHRKKHKTFGPHEGPDCLRLYTRQHEVVLVDGNFSDLQIGVRGRLRVRVLSSEHAHFENFCPPNLKRVLSKENSYS